MNVNYGSNQSFTISPNTGYQIASLTVDRSSVLIANSYTFSNVTANHAISATFSPIVYTVNASAGNNGSITPSGSVNVNYGSNQSFTISPNTGYQIASLTVDGSSVLIANSYTFSNVTANHAISATYIPIINPTSKPVSSTQAPTPSSIQTSTPSSTQAPTPSSIQASTPSSTQAPTSSSQTPPPTPNNPTQFRFILLIITILGIVALIVSSRILGTSALLVAFLIAFVAGLIVELIILFLK